MIITECKICGAKLRIVGSNTDLKLLDSPQWSAGFPCVIRNCNGVANKVSLREMSGSKEIPVQSYFRALHGLGLNPFVAADPNRIQELFCTKTVQSVDVSPIGQPVRSIIKRLTFSDGTVLHFSTSNEGACIYLIEEKEDAYSYMGPDRDIKGGTKNRVQAGYSNTTQSKERESTVGASNVEFGHGSSDDEANKVYKCPTS